MGNKSATVRQSDVTRTVRGAMAGGIMIGRIEVDHITGMVIIIPRADAEDAPGANPSANPCDRLLIRK